MWITTTDGEWYVHELRGAVYVSWVRKQDRRHASVFSRQTADEWLLTLMKATGLQLSLAPWEHVPE